MRVRGSMTRNEHLIFDTFPKPVDGNLSMTQILGVSHLCVCVCACVYRGGDGPGRLDSVGKWVIKIRYMIVS